MVSDSLNNKELVDSKLVDFAVAIAQEAGELTLSFFNSSNLDISKKLDGSPVTEADHSAERLLRKRIIESFPEDSIIGEEQEDIIGSSGRTWTLDPIDGTQSFIRGVPLFGNLVAFEDTHGPAIGVINLPAINECVWAGRGSGCFTNGKEAHVSKTENLENSCLVTSELDYWQPISLLDSFSKAGAAVRTWGDAYGYFLVATGLADAMLDPVVNTWDIAPMLTIIPEAGGLFTNFSGLQHSNGGNAIATNPNLHPILLNLIND